MYLLLLWLAIVSSTSIIVWLGVALFLDRDTRKSVFIVLVGLAAVGATVGITGGMSRVGAVGEIMGAVLGLLGGVIVWLFANDQTKGTLVSACAIVFSISLFISYFEGASRRASPESYLFWRGQCIDIYSDKEILNDPMAFAVMDKSIGKLCAHIFNNENEQNLARK